MGAVELIHTGPLQTVLLGKHCEREVYGCMHQQNIKNADAGHGQSALPTTCDFMMIRMQSDE
jgi:hypothetical protein